MEVGEWSREVSKSSTCFFSLPLMAYGPHDSEPKKWGEAMKGRSERNRADICLFY